MEGFLRIAVVEDNPALARGIAYRLEDAGHGVDILRDGLEAEAFLTREDPALVVLDINLPGQDGLAVLRSLRARGRRRPIILLSARADTEDRIIGLDAGADDYLVKPFEMAELEARVRALLRRQAEPLPATETVGGLRFERGARQIFAEGAPLDLPRRELSMFESLLAARGRIVSKSVLLDQAYGTGADVGEAVVEVYLSRLRKRLKPYGVSIRSHRGLGYQILGSRTK